MSKHGCDDPRCACQMEKPCCAYHAAFGGWCQQNVNRVDYRNLLYKYMAHVGDQEGTGFLTDGYKTDRFTNDEWAELQRIANER